MFHRKTIAVIILCFSSSFLYGFDGKETIFENRDFQQYPIKDNPLVYRNEHYFSGEIARFPVFLDTSRLVLGFDGVGQFSSLISQLLLAVESELENAYDMSLLNPIRLPNSEYPYIGAGEVWPVGLRTTNKLSYRDGNSNMTFPAFRGVEYAEASSEWDMEFKNQLADLGVDYGLVIFFTISEYTVKGGLAKEPNSVYLGANGHEELTVNDFLRYPVNVLVFNGMLLDSDAKIVGVASEGIIALPHSIGTRFRQGTLFFPDDRGRNMTSELLLKVWESAEDTGDQIVTAKWQNAIRHLVDSLVNNDPQESTGEVQHGS